jgi:hypothetical protein
MVSDFECKACEIKFSVGPYHYHNFESGFVGKCLFVCRSCGGQHAIEISLTASTNEFDNVYEVIVQDYTQKGKKYLLLEARKHDQRSIAEALALVNNTPFTLSKELTEKGAKQAVNRLHNRGVFAESKVYEKRKNPFFGIDKRDRFLHKERAGNGSWHEIHVNHSCYKGQRIIVDLLDCSECLSSGSLTSKWDEADSSCPSCKESKLFLTGSWLT